MNLIKNVKYGFAALNRKYKKTRKNRASDQLPPFFFTKMKSLHLKNEMNIYDKLL